MTNSRDHGARERLGELFERARALSPEERRAFLDEACGGNAALRDELSSLLASHAAAPRFLERLGEQVLPETLNVLAEETLRIGRVVGRYEILERLGGGGMGEVYKARDLELDRLVALKFLSPRRIADPEARARLKSEARAASALDHPNIAVVHEIGTFRPLPGNAVADRLFIAMAYYPGETIKAKVVRGPLPVAEALGYAAQVAEGLAAAHEAGIVHRDIKPANLIVTARSLVKILDFGVAKLAGTDVTREGATLGTTAYMSPEQTRGDAVDPRTDVWSLGVVLYEMLTGRRPFPGENDETVIYTIRHDTPPPISRPDVSDALAGVIQACLAKEPSHRHARADTLLAELRALADPRSPAKPFAQPFNQPVTAGIAAGPAARAWRWVGVLATGLVLLAGGWLARRELNAPPPGSPTLVPNRVVVAPFVNETGLSDLDPVGRMAADWITEGVSRLGSFEVVPATTILAAAAEEPLLDPLDLAHSSEAGLLVTGRYYRSTGTLYFQAQLLEAGSGRILRPVEAASVAGDSIMAGVSRIRERVLDALMPETDTASHLRSVVEPLGYEAYREYLQSMEAFLRSDWEDFAARSERVIELEPEHPMPRLILAIALTGLGRFAQADTVLAPVLARRSALGPFEVGTLDMSLGMLRGDLPLVYDGNRRAARVAPGTIAEYSMGFNAVMLNRPREAVRILENLGPDRLEAPPFYWWGLIEAHLMLGDGEAALRSARAADGRYPDSPLPLHYELQALAALGKVREMEALVQRRLAFPAEGTPSPGQSLRQAAAWLDASDPTAALRLRRRALSWYEEAARDGSPSLGLRAAWAELLVELGDRTAALALLEGAIGAKTGDGGEVPPPRNPEEILVAGVLGRIAALDGDATGAERLARLLVAVPPRQGLTGVVDPAWRLRPWYQAEIFAALGDAERAVAALRRAHAAGVRFSPWWRVAPMFVPLRGHQEFEALLRPVG